MRKIILSERDLINLVRRVIKEESLVETPQTTCWHSNGPRSSGKNSCSRHQCGSGGHADSGNESGSRFECMGKIAPGTGGGNGDIKKGGGKKELEFNGEYSELVSGIKKAKAAGGFGNMSEAQALAWAKKAIGNGPGGGPDNPTPQGKVSCSNADEIGGSGGRWCLKVGLKGWRLTICLGSNC